MTLRHSTSIEFDGAGATVADVIEAAEDLRSRVGPDATVRVQCHPEIHLSGMRVRAITAGE